MLRHKLQNREKECIQLRKQLKSHQEGENNLSVSILACLEKYFLHVFPIVQSLWWWFSTNYILFFLIFCQSFGDVNVMFVSVGLFIVWLGTLALLSSFIAYMIIYLIRFNHTWAMSNALDYNYFNGQNIGSRIVSNFVLVSVWNLWLRNGILLHERIVGQMCMCPSKISLLKLIIWQFFSSQTLQSDAQEIMDCFRGEKNQTSDNRWYSAVVRMFALTLFILSPAAYRFVRGKFMQHTVPITTYANHFNYRERRLTKVISMHK